MGQLTQEEINVDLFDEVKRLKKELYEYKEINSNLRGYAEKLEIIIENNLGSLDDYLEEDEEEIE